MTSKFQIYKLNKVKAIDEKISEINYGLISEDIKENFLTYNDAKEYLLKRVSDHRDFRDCVILEVFNY
jgi:hypothetical protein